MLYIHAMSIMRCIKLTGGKCTLQDLMPLSDEAAHLSEYAPSMPRRGGKTVLAATTCSEGTMIVWTASWLNDMRDEKRIELV